MDSWAARLKAPAKNNRFPDSRNHLQSLMALIDSELVVRRKDCSL